MQQLLIQVAQRLERDAQNGWRELGGAGVLGELAKGVRRAQIVG